MAGRGPAPKQQHQRERDTRRRQADSTVVVADNRLRGPKLPESLLDPHPETVVYWNAWRKSPNAQLFTATDWEGLKRAALLHDYVWKSAGKPSAAAISELRLVEERYGASFVDRQRAKIHIEQKDADKGADDGSNVVALRSVGRSQIADRLKDGDPPTF